MAVQRSSGAEYRSTSAVHRSTGAVQVSAKRESGGAHRVRGHPVYVFPSPHPLSSSSGLEAEDDAA